MLNNGRVVRGGGAPAEVGGASADYLLGWMTVAGLRGLVDALLGGCVRGW